MSTITVRNLPKDVVQRIKRSAKQHSRSMEQEVRDLLQRRYGARTEVLRRIRERWLETPTATPEEVESWRSEGRP